jgi:hypothetical protein
MRTGPGLFYVNSPAQISLRVSLDATGAEFKLGTGVGSNCVFKVDGNELQDITADVTLAQVTQGTTYIFALT